MNCTNYISDIISGISTILAVIIAAWFGLWIYYRQKEFELVKQRYLDEGFDKLVASAEHFLNIYYHNWARCLEILKSFKDLGIQYDPKELEKGFWEIEQPRFPFVTHQKVGNITKSKIIWEVYQLVISFAQKGSSIAKNEIPEAIRMTIKGGKSNAEVKRLFEEALDQLQKLDEEAREYHHFLSCLIRIVAYLERQKFSFKKIHELHKQNFINSTLSQLEKQFAGKLEKAKLVKSKSDANPSDSKDG